MFLHQKPPSERTTETADLGYLPLNCALISSLPGSAFMGLTVWASTHVRWRFILLVAAHGDRPGRLMYAHVQPRGQS
jgi:hypothetical protein